MKKIVQIPTREETLNMQQIMCMETFQFLQSASKGYSFFLTVQQEFSLYMINDQYLIA